MTDEQEAELRQRIIEACDDTPYLMLLPEDEAKVVIRLWNLGIDAHLEAITRSEWSEEDTRTQSGKLIDKKLRLLMHPEDLAVLVRRLEEYVTEQEYDTASTLRGDILMSLGLAED